jgi:hypothetical protein
MYLELGLLCLVKLPICCPLSWFLFENTLYHFHSCHFESRKFVNFNRSLNLYFTQKAVPSELFFILTMALYFFEVFITNYFLACKIIGAYKRSFSVDHTKNSRYNFVFNIVQNEHRIFAFGFLF